MDKYYEQADSYDRQQEYYECIAQCPDGKDCGCNGSAEPSPQAILAVVIALLIYPGVFLWGGWLLRIREKIKDNKEKKGKK